MTNDNLKMIVVVGAEIDHIIEKYQVSYIDACLMYCDKYDVEAESLGEMLKKHQQIVSKIQDEAEELNFIKKESCGKIEFDE